MSGTVELKYCVVSFDPQTFKVTRTNKTYIYEWITVREYREKWGLE